MGNQNEALAILGEVYGVNGAANSEHDAKEKSAMGLSRRETA